MMENQGVSFNAYVVHVLHDCFSLGYYSRNISDHDPGQDRWLNSSNERNTE
jgi:hypothetical protein